VQLYQGWTPVSEMDKEARWEAKELADRMDQLFGERPTAYQADRSPLRRVTGVGEGA
jgi:hypothetical protein